tara:strand:- start:224 stop:340 length:117 start_codon:yes stop_codon:yes gene_type:complete
VLAVEVDDEIASPLGEALLGNFKGDMIEYEVGDNVRQA